MARALPTLLLAAAAGLAGATSASAAPSPGLYGGGAMLDFVQFVSLRVAPDRREFRARAILVTDCSPRFGDGLSETITIARGRLSEERRYAAATTFTDELEPGIPRVGGLRADGTIRFSARLLAGDSARGAVRVRTTYSDPQSGEELSRCDTGRVAWTARLPRLDAGSGRFRPQPGIHRGTTAQRQPFLMEVTRAGRMVSRAGMAASVECPSAVGLPLDVVAHRLPVGDGGRFGGRGGFQRRFTLADGTSVEEDYTWTLRGRFGQSGAAGSFRLQGVVRRASDGATVGGCDSGPNRWRASR